ncbi:MAG TPA: hypothetical protein VF597_02350 [Candidatus Saccharimonadales bacterium]|jgi:hypothetical protein
MSAQVRREVITEDTTPTGRSGANDPSKPSSSAVAARAVWFVTGVIVTLLGLRVLLLLLGANETNGFVSFIYGLSGIFAAPFFGMFSYQPTYGVSTFEVSSLVAMAIYGLVGAGIARLLTLGSRRA